LRAQPLLAVLRPVSPIGASGAIASLQAAGLRHVEIAWNNCPGWARECRELQRRFPSVHLGGASVCDEQGLEAVAAAGLAFAVSPVLDPSLLQRSAALGVTLVPGVFSPSEVHQARRLGCPIVKLFPAAPLGPAYWRSLNDPLGPLPFCIAAGGLSPASVLPWLAAGVDAVALGSALFAPDPESDALDPAVLRLLERLASRAPVPVVSTDREVLARRKPDLR
jgi:2-dehydro-3-deoxyphosphogluconate aldolase/(4S)-4-hydroxy-2-oxoglutarate aldolase